MKTSEQIKAEWARLCEIYILQMGSEVRTMLQVFEWIESDYETITDMLIDQK